MKGLNGFLLMLLSSISVDLLSTGMQRFKSVTTPIYRLFVLPGGTHLRQPLKPSSMLLTGLPPGRAAESIEVEQRVLLRETSVSLSAMPPW